MNSIDESSPLDTFSLLCDLAERVNRQEPSTPEPALYVACDCGRWTEAAVLLQHPPPPREKKCNALSTGLATHGRKNALPRSMLFGNSSRNPEAFPPPSSRTCWKCLFSAVSTPSSHRLFLQAIPYPQTNGGSEYVEMNWGGHLPICVIAVRGDKLSSAWPRSLWKSHCPAHAYPKCRADLKRSDAANGASANGSVCSVCALEKRTYCSR